MARRVLYGDALAVFDEEALTLVQEDEESFKKSLEALAHHVFPKNALSSQKAWLRRSDDVKKKPNMSTRTWMARLQEINQMLSEFPPTFSKTQRISDEDFVEVIEYGIPYSWRAKMAEQGFVPVNHTLTEIVEFCNKMEYAEEMTGINNSQNNQNNRKTGQHAEADSASGDTLTGAILHAKAPQGVSKKRRERHTNFAESNGSDGCALHLKATDHTTGECRVLLGQAKKMRAVWDAQPREKTFQRQKVYNNDKQHGGNQNKKYNGDFHTLMEKIEQVEESVQKALRQQKTTTGKRKTRDETPEENEDEETNGNFNSQDNFVCELDQLSISEDDQQSE
jgi:hypothetical protein